MHTHCIRLCCVSNGNWLDIVSFACLVIAAVLALALAYTMNEEEMFWRGIWIIKLTLKNISRTSFCAGILQKSIQTPAITVWKMSNLISHLHVIVFILIWNLTISVNFYCCCGCCLLAFQMLVFSLSSFVRSLFRWVDSFVHSFVRSICFIHSESVPECATGTCACVHLKLC